MADPVAVYPPLPEIAASAHCSGLDQYKSMYKESVEDPYTFWERIAKEFYWKQLPSKEKFLEYNFDVSKGPISIKWMQDAVTNICYNVLDRNVLDKNLGDTVAFYW